MHPTSSLPDMTLADRQDAERDLRRFTRQWTMRDNRLARINIIATLTLFFASLTIATSALNSTSLPSWLIAPLVLISAFCGVRLYVLQHDAGHNSLFSTARCNLIAGHGLSIFTLTPFTVMQHNHNAHHAHLGDLDARATTEIFTMTLREWEVAPPATRLWYRLYRNPFILVPLGGVFTYVIAYRWPKNTLKIAPYQVLAHNGAIAAWLILLWVAGDASALIIYGSTVFVASCIGVVLVYLQHNFEDTWWDRKPDLNPAQAALQGSSALQLGAWFDLAVANITYHNIHHFNANVPSYRLRACHRALSARYEIQTIGWTGALRSFGLKLWDEDQRRLVAFPTTQKGQGLWGRKITGQLP